MKKVGLIINKDKDVDFTITNKILDWILEKSVLVYVNDKLDYNHQRLIYVDKLQMFENVDFVITLGGDGTILGVAREIVEYEIPILGVNLGHLGFITEVEIKELFYALEKVLNGDYNIEKRIMLHAQVITKGKEVKSFYALNDICITRGYLSRMVKLNTYINNDFVDIYNSDGLLVSTPTGSTAYSLSAGGPIVNPTLNVMLITPICPHSLKSRTLVVSENDKIDIHVDGDSGDVIYITADGQEGYKLLSGDVVKVKKLEKSLSLIKVLDRSFYDILRNKLKDR